ncbi:MAG: penicillin acylase family protein [Gemmatimonadaceae bacterium]|nr:penicillin acylase family protein [Gemmatimonadaceae bacterium]
MTSFLRPFRANVAVAMACHALMASGVSAQSAAPVESLSIAGLTASVEVRRDRWGVPHIYAKNQRDLFFAQGFVAAQDRLFQMEMWRRQGEGRLAEVLGPSAVSRDRFARLFQYRGNMAREWAAYGPDTKAIVSAFVAGINAYIARAGDALPVEFGMLGFKPEPWSITVPLARPTGLSGVSNGSSEVLRAQLVAAIGAARVNELLPADPVRALDPAPGLDLAGISAASLGGFGSTFADVAYNRIEGSNNWVVNGTKSATGRPILANDPHRVITNPAVRYLTHLVAPGWNVIGAGEPSSPGVAIGHNDRIAFGLTVVGMDQQDVYVEALGPCPGAAAASLGCYRHQGGWRRMQQRVDTIRVKGAAPQVTLLQFTVHGPIVSIDTARRRAFAIRSVHSEPGTASYLGSLALDRARNWAQFEAAMTKWLMPSENMVYADVDGNIGWIAAGLMPKRAWSGLLPVPGDGSHEWTGFVPGRQLPRSYNPSSGFINTSNDNILPPGYTTPISYEWATRYRGDRVREVLSATRTFSVEEFAQLQHDDKSLLAAALMPSLVAAAARSGTAARPDVALLTGWNQRMSREETAPTLFAAWAPALYRHAITRETSGMGDVTGMLAARPSYHWLEQYLQRHAGTPALDSVVLGALDDASADVVRRLGADRTAWQWGKVHTASFRHPLSATFDLPPASRSGDANTVNATGGVNFRQSAGASFREVIDLADFDRSIVTNVPGQSADPRSPHYADLLALWAEDRYFPLVYSRARVEAETERITWLMPRRRGR